MARFINFQSLITDISNEEDELVEASAEVDPNVVEEATETTAEVENMVEAVDEVDEVNEDIKEQIEVNENLIEEHPEAVTVDTVAASQEAFFSSMSRLNYKITDFRSLRVSLESGQTPIDMLRQVTNNYKKVSNKLTVSQEDLGDSIREILDKLIAKLLPSFSLIVKNTLNGISPILNKDENTVVDLTDEDGINLQRALGFLTGIAKNPTTVLNDVNKYTDQMIAEFVSTSTLLQKYNQNAKIGNKWLKELEKENLISEKFIKAYAYEDIADDVMNSAYSIVSPSRVDIYVKKDTAKYTGVLKHLVVTRQENVVTYNPYKILIKDLKPQTEMLAKLSSRFSTNCEKINNVVSRLAFSTEKSDPMLKEQIKAWITSAAAAQIIAYNANLKAMLKVCRIYADAANRQ